MFVKFPERIINDKMNLKLNFGINLSQDIPVKHKFEKCDVNPGDCKRSSAHFNIYNSQKAKYLMKKFLGKPNICPFLTSKGRPEN